MARPTKGETRTTVQIRVYEAEHAALLAVCKDRRRTTAEVVRQLMGAKLRQLAERAGAKGGGQATG